MWFQRLQIQKLLCPISVFQRENYLLNNEVHTEEWSVDLICVCFR